MAAWQCRHIARTTARPPLFRLPQGERGTYVTTDHEQAEGEDYSPEFREWLVKGSPGSVQREKYERAMRAWNRGASEAEVAQILGLPLPKERE